MIDTTIVLGDERLAEAVLRSLEPDNIDLPEGVRIETRAEGGRVVVVLECDIDRVLSCRSTLDEILMIVQSIIGVLSRRDHGSGGQGV